MTIQPMLKEIRQIISAEYNNDSTLINFYVDDGNLCAPHNIMIRIIDLIDLIGPKYGYYIKKTKGTILLGKCDTTHEALNNKQNYINKGYAEDIIKLYYDNNDLHLLCLVLKIII
jgi:hypothetical protein